jgi:hypothetical protein
MTRREFSFATIAALVADLCRLRSGPEEMPYSPALCGGLIVASVAFDVVTANALGDGNDALARSLVSTVLTLGLCAVALAMRQFANRFVQTASALVACSFVFSLLVLPLAWLAGPHVDSGTPLTPLQVLLGWGTLALIVWSLSVNAHIMRRAMDSSFVFGFALVTSWAIADWALAHALFDAG